MGALPIIADVFRCAINWNNGSGQLAENVIHVRAPGKTPTQVATAIDTHTAPNMFLSVANIALAPNVDVTPLDGSTATSRHALAHWLGTAAGEPIPQVAAIVTFHTALRGRSHRGRLYLPFTSENRVGGGLWTDPANPPAASLAWANWIAGNVVDGFHLVVASYLHSTSQDVTDATVQNYLATQRRRQERVAFP